MSEWSGAFFGTPLPLRGGFPPKKEVFRLSYPFFIREFCSIFGRRLGIANSPESTFLSHVNVRTIITHDAAHTIASLTLFLKHTASPSKYATHSSLL